jgi:hypothetical protein
MLFEYENALNDKGIAVKDLPKSIKDKIKTFNGLCRELNGTDEEDLEKQTELNTQIDALDQEIAGEISSYTPEPPAPAPETPPAPAPETPPAPAPETPPAPQDKKEGGIDTGTVLIGGAVLLGIGLLVKRLMGK